MKVIEVNLNFNSLTYNNTPRKIVLHHAEASRCSVQDVNQWHKSNGWSGIGYHYFIRKDGSIYRGRPESAQGAHCPGANTESIGICFEGAFMKETMNETQYNAGIELIKDINKRYGKMPIYGHGEIYSTDCPGVNFPLSKFKCLESNNNTLEDDEDMKITEIFCEQWYLENNSDVKASGMDAREHYEKYGKEEGRKPNCGVPEGWNEAGYLMNNADVNNNVSSGNGYRSGLEHYLINGWKENRSWEYKHTCKVEDVKQEIEENGEKFYRVCTGSYKDINNARTQKDVLKEKGVNDAFIVEYYKK